MPIRLKAKEKRDPKGIFPTTEAGLFVGKMVEVFVTSAPDNPQSVLLTRREDVREIVLKMLAPE